MMSVGTFIAPLLVGPFSLRFGRKHGLWAATLLIYIAAALQIGTTSKGVLYFARLLMGKEMIFTFAYSVLMFAYIRVFDRLVHNFCSAICSRSRPCPPTRHNLCILPNFPVSGRHHWLFH